MIFPLLAMQIKHTSINKVQRDELLLNKTQGRILATFRIRHTPVARKSQLLEKKGQWNQPSTVVLLPFSF